MVFDIDSMLSTIEEAIEEYESTLNFPILEDTLDEEYRLYPVIDQMLSQNAEISRSLSGSFILLASGGLKTAKSSGYLKLEDTTSERASPSATPAVLSESPSRSSSRSLSRSQSLSDLPLRSPFRPIMSPYSSVIFEHDTDIRPAIKDSIVKTPDTVWPTSPSHKNTKKAVPDQIAKNCPIESKSEPNTITEPVPIKAKWACLCCAFLCNIASWGATEFYNIMVKHYLDQPTSILRSISSTGYYFLSGLNSSMGLILAPLIITLSNLIGIRATVLFGACIQIAGYIGTSFKITRDWELFLGQGLAIPIGSGLVYIPVIIALVTRLSQSSKRKATALGFANSGIGIGGLLFYWIPQLLLDKTSNVSWSLRFVGIAIAVLSAMVILLGRGKENLAIVKPNEEMEFRKSNEFKSLVGPRHICAYIWVAMMMLSYFCFQVSLPLYCSSINLSTIESKIVITLFCVGQILGLPVLGLLSDIFGKINMAILNSLLGGVLAFAFWIPATSIGSIAPYSLINGALVGMIWINFPLLASDSLSMKLIPYAIAIASSFGGISVVFSRFIVMKLEILRDGKSFLFLYVQFLIGCLFIIGMLLLLVIRYMKIGKRLHDHVNFLQRKRSRLLHIIANRNTSSVTERRNSGNTRHYKLKVMKPRTYMPKMLDLTLSPDEQIIEMEVEIKSIEDSFFTRGISGIIKQMFFASKI